MKWNENERFPVQLMCTVRETAHYSLGNGFKIASTEPRGQLECFFLELTTEVAGSKKESDERPSKRAANRLQRSTIETVPRVASMQSRVPWRTEGEREFQASGPDAQKDQPPTVFSSKLTLLWKSDDYWSTAACNPSAAQLNTRLHYRCGPWKTWSKFVAQCVLQ